ncbi:hypothetical protein GCM10009730_53770 [Streptomyces albidochromogenes]
MLVAEVPSGAQVMTVTGSLEPPVAPGSTPHPTSNDAPTAVAVAQATEVAIFERNGRVVKRLRRPVMCMHVSASWVTGE